MLAVCHVNNRVKLIIWLNLRVLFNYSAYLVANMFCLHRIINNILPVIQKYCGTTKNDEFYHGKHIK